MTVTTINPATRVAHHLARPLPVGLPLVDRILRRTLTPDAHGWQAVEAVTVALVGAEPWLTAEGGPLAGLSGDVLTDPLHRTLLAAYGRLRTAGEFVAPLSSDVLGAALAAVGCADPEGAVDYLRRLWTAGWEHSVGVPVTVAVELLTARADYVRRADALAAEGVALGLEDVRPLRGTDVVVEAAHNRVLESAPALGAFRRAPVNGTDTRVSNFAVSSNDAENLDTPPRPIAATPTGEAVRSPASGGERCPNPQHRWHENHAGTVLTTRAMRCERRYCPACGQTWQAERIAPVLSWLNGAPAYRLTASRGKPEAALMKRVTRTAAAEYVRVPSPDMVLVLVSVPMRGAEVVAGEDVADVLSAAMETASRTRRANVTASPAWRHVAQAERTDVAVEADTADTPEAQKDGRYLGNSNGLDRGVAVLRRPWWNLNVTRKGEGMRERLRAEGSPEDIAAALAALWNERVLYDAETLAADRAVRAARADRVADVDPALMDAWERDSEVWWSHGAA